MKNPPTPFRHILCPVDFSRPSRAALRHAVVLARRSGSRLTVMFANDPLLMTGAAAAAYDVRRLTAQTLVELRRFVRRALGPAAEMPDLVVALGSPSLEIIKTVSRIGADVLVMGTHGLSGVRKAFFGSTTERVLRKTSVPVLAVPSRSKRDSAGIPSGRTILAPIDLEETTIGQAKGLARIARDFEGRALFAYALPELRAPVWMSRDVGEIAQRLRANANRKLDQIAAAVHQGCETRLVEGEPVAALTKLATTSKAALIVLTLKKGPGPFGPRRGSITYRLLCAGVAPVLAMPEPAK